ncbi:MAG: phosphatase PAP2 family protein [Deltaproteobacteria bacterium]|nr:phosphatase PAP2 family protein [Deltaproteobacteria bacterium]
MTSRTRALTVVLAATTVFSATASANELRLDPVTDSVTIATGALFTLSIEALSRGKELRPQEPGDEDDLFFLDRSVVRGSSADLTGDRFLSDALYVAAFAAGIFKPVLTGLEEGAEQGWIDLALYAESAAINGAITELVKIAVRRPRPIAYIRVREGTYDPETNTALSFWSGHTSSVAAIGATMTYLEFYRNRCTARPWISLAAWALATAVTGVARVTSRNHFITDVIAGAAFGTGVGLLVPHLHRRASRIRPTAAVLDRGATLGVAGEL